MTTTTHDFTTQLPGIRTLQELAISYAERGWAIFPIQGVSQESPEGPFNCDCPKRAKCENPGKHPLTPRGFQDATTNVNIIKAWWGNSPNANIGIATGEVSGIVVVDVDGPAGVASLAGKEMPDTLMASTGRGDGGIHYYFQWPGFKVKNAVKLLPGIDIRADGGYAILPGSRHKSGKFYEWQNDAEIAAFPQWTLDKLRENAKGPTPKAAPKSVAKGGRNNYLTNHTGKLRRLRTMSIEQIRAAIHVANTEDLVEPLSEDVVDKIVDSVTKYDSASLLLTAEKSDVGNAERMASLYKDQAVFCADLSLWRVYDRRRGIWPDDTGVRMKRLGQETARQTQIAAANIPQGVAGRDEWIDWARSMESGRAQREMISAAEPLMEFPEDAAFNAHNLLLPVKNGVVDLATGGLLPHAPEYFFTMASPVKYDRAARSDILDRVLDHATGGNEEFKGYLKMAAGYTLTGLTTEEALFVALGPAASGKSTITDAMSAAMGEFAITTEVETFLSNRNAANGSAPKEDVLKLDGPRMALTAEPDSKRRFRNGFLKLATGGDTMSARGIHAKHSRQFKPNFKLWIAANEFPAIDANDTGAWRRIHRLPLDHVVPEAERDSSIKLFLTDPSGGGPAVLAWMVEGAQEYLKAGKLEMPAIIRNATADLRNENDPIREFLDDECEVGLGLRAGTTDLWERFDRWQQRSDHAHITKRKLGELLEARSFTTERTNGARFRVGLALQAMGSHGREHTSKNLLANIPMESRF